MALINKLSAIGNAIREKTGKTDLLTLDQMSEEIKSIETGGGGDDTTLISLANSLIDKSITEIQISEEVTKIGDYAFAHCRNLKDITIPNTVNTIGMSAFLRCSSLKSIELPRELTRLETNTFQECTGFETIVIPEKVTYIAAYVFEGCINLKTISLPQGISYIATLAFRNSGVETITLPNTITQLGSDMFNNCSNLTNLTVECSIEKNFFLANAPKLTTESVNSVINALKDLTGKTAQTLKLHAEVKAKLTEAQIASITSKNWTLA